LFIVQEPEGSPTDRVAPILEPGVNEVFHKTGSNAFLDGALEMRLHSEGISQLVLAGIRTDLEVDSTARSANDLGWLTFIAADATAARTEERHVVALRDLARGISVVTRVVEVSGIQHFLIQR
jgi:nicotinamidase-related amidase